MVITQLRGGLGEQMFRYAAARRLANKLGVELKLVMSGEYLLDDFNLRAAFAEQYEIRQVLEHHGELGLEETFGEDTTRFMPEVLDYPDDVFMRGNRQSEKYFADIADIIRQDFTLKRLNGAVTEAWLKKIRAADCAVSLHVRRDEHKKWEILEFFGILTIDYYVDCVEVLKRFDERLTVFVFADDIKWAKEHFHFGVSTEYVEGVERAAEELFLIGQCRHHIIANSARSWWGAWLNPNPDKKVFAPEPWYRHPRYNVDLIPEGWIKIPARLDKFSTVNVMPGLSIVVYSAGDSDALKRTLDNLKAQKYFWCEVNIVDDGNSELCREAAKMRKDFRLFSIKQKLGQSAAWNLGINMACGQFVLLLKGGDLIVTERLLEVLTAIRFSSCDVLHTAERLVEMPNGRFAFGGRRFSPMTDSALKTLNGVSTVKLSAMKGVEIIAHQRLNTLIGTKIFRRDFLIENGIRFDEELDGVGAELLFLVECFSKIDAVVLTSQAFYLEPQSKNAIDISEWREEFNRFVSELKQLDLGEDFELLFARRFLDKYAAGD